MAVQGDKLSPDVNRRICIFTTAHALDDVRVHGKIGQSFLSRGFEVAWVGPDYRLKTGKQTAESGYQYALFPRKPGKLGRLLAYRAAYRTACTLGKFDFYYCPDPDSASTALRLRKRFGGRVIFDIHEIYHGNAMFHWGVAGPLFGNRIVSGWIKEKIRHTCRKSDLVMAVNRSVLDEYANSRKDAFIVRNCPPVSFGAKLESPYIKSEDSFTLMHGKGMSLSGTRKMLAAVGIALRTVRSLKVIVFALNERNTGKAAETTIHEMARAANASEALDLRQPVSLNEMPGILSVCDLGLIMYDRRLGKASLPNRLFEYMAAGLPILAPSYSDEIVPILNSENCGLAVDCEEPEDVAQAIIRLQQQPEQRREMGKRAREGFLKRHNWEAEIERVIAHITPS
jgi:glycosyltransferase involved in cell wall biosynthesis